MGFAKYGLIVFFLLMILAPPVRAADSKCSYYKNIQFGATSFGISSRPAIGCAVQVVSIVARQGGKRIADLKADVDYLAHSARTVDLSGDGNPQLAIFSRTIGEDTATEALDIYWLDGAQIHRATFPELDETGAYKGGDRFYLGKRHIVRNFPLYREGDVKGKPSGASRTIKYELKNGVLTLYSPPENVIPALEKSTEVVSEASTKLPSASKPSVKEIKITDAGIEIVADGVIEKFKTMRLDKPERIAIDIPDADSALAGRKIKVERFGVSKVRVGRNKGFLRIVLDSNLKKFPKNQVNSSENGLLVGFTE